MEYYGKILCISYNDLTYDDRPVMVNGKADYSRSRTLKREFILPLFPKKKLAPNHVDTQLQEVSGKGENQCSSIRKRSGRLRFGRNSHHAPTVSGKDKTKNTEI